MNNFAVKSAKKEHKANAAATANNFADPWPLAATRSDRLRRWN
jgi:hypothetical protein